jgi:uncharacterized DUF497 family protein
MKITFDPVKQAANIQKHGLDFADLDTDFFLQSMVIAAKNDRYMAIGKHQDQMISVVFAPLGSEAISIISMRLASRKERGII